MNILHHKSWHVRNKDNIARVRRDEAKAAAELQEKERKIALAEQEVKLSYLRSKAKTQRQSHTVTSADQLDSSPTSNTDSKDGNLKHINFFADLEDGTVVSSKGNEKYLKEKKEEQEKYEKQIGYLTYLGQDTNESLGKRDWYDVAPKKVDAYDDRGKKLEVGLKAKSYNDPLNVMKKYIKDTEKIQNLNAQLKLNTKIDRTIPIPFDAINEFYRDHKAKHHKNKSKKLSKSKKHKKEKSKKRSKSKSRTEAAKSEEETQKLLRLRAERLKREEVEKNRAKMLMAKFTNTGDDEPKTKKVNVDEWEPKPIEPIKVKQKYNSQFNPEIAKQNYEDMRRY